MAQKQRIHINLAHVDSIPLDINPEDEEIFRMAEKSVNVIWNHNLDRYQTMDENQILAITAFQFAKRLIISTENEKKLNNLLIEFEKSLDEKIHKIN